MGCWCNFGELVEFVITLEEKLPGDGDGLEGLDDAAAEDTNPEADETSILGDATDIDDDLMDDIDDGKEGTEQTEGFTCTELVFGVVL